VLDSPTLGAFDVVYDPQRAESIVAGQMTSRDNRLFLDAWTSFQSRSMRSQTAPRGPDLALSDYRIEAAIGGDLELKATTRVKVRPSSSGLRAVEFDITPLMTVTSATVDGRPAEVLQRESPRGNAMRAGNEMFVVAPAEPLAAGRDYEFVFEGGLRHRRSRAVRHRPWRLVSDARPAILHLRSDFPPSQGSGPGGAGRNDRNPRRWRQPRHAFPRARSHPVRRL
jgi:hypothetical protein